MADSEQQNVVGRSSSFGPLRLFIAVVSACLIVSIAEPIWRPPAFSFFYLGVFLSLGVVFLALQIRIFGDRVAVAGNWLAAALAARGAFNSNSANEIPKFALIRIMFGILLVQRASYILFYAFESDWLNPFVLNFMLLSLCVSLFVLVGLFAQLSLFILIVVQWQVGELVLETSTLGNDIAAIVAVILVLTNSGAHYSIDAIIRRRNNFLGKFVSWTYAPRGIQSNSGLQLTKFAALFSYWCVCLYSLSMHLNEPAWTTGVAGPQLLASNFMSRYFYLFVSIFTQSEFAVQLARFSLWIMMLWYAAIIPFVLIGGWLRKYVIWWGLLFFILSTFGLQLGWLGPFEFLLWACVFWERGFMHYTKSMAIAYDDHCNLCDRTVNFLLRVDIFRRIEFKPISENGEFLKNHGITHDLAMTDLYCIDRLQADRHVAGYDLYMLLTRRVLLLTPLFPVLWLGKVTRIGPHIYAWVARRRTRLFGVCQIPTHKPRVKFASDIGIAARPIERTDFSLAAAIHILMLGMAYIAVIPAPFLGWNGLPLPSPFREVLVGLSNSAHVYGIAPINVFNATDLGMSSNWFTLSAVDTSGEEVLLPLIDEDGSRLRWHMSDRIYFGRTLIWRRAAIGTTGCLFDRDRRWMEDFARLHERGLETQPVQYVYRQYHQPLADPVLLQQGKFHLGERAVVCTRELVLPS